MRDKIFSPDMMRYWNGVEAVTGNSLVKRIRYYMYEQKKVRLSDGNWTGWDPVGLNMGYDLNQPMIQVKVSNTKREGIRVYLMGPIHIDQSGFETQHRWIVSDYANEFLHIW